MSKWDQRFLDLAEHIAEWSHDPRTKVGAVIVDDQKRVVSMGYNGFPRGIKDSEERYNDRSIKHLFVCHAERNAFDNAPHSVEGCTMYVPLLPCNECAKSIIQNGITKVITYKTNREDTFHWDITRTMFQEAGVMLEEIDREINLNAGQPWLRTYDGKLK
jgi:dCMP deaminase